MDIMTATDWVIAQLKADSTLHAIVADRVYLDQIPPQVTEVFPYVVVSKIPQEPVTNNMADIIMYNDLVQVNVYDKASSAATAASAINRIIAILHKKSGTSGGGMVIGCVFASEVNVPSEVSGMELYQRRTAEFQINTQ